jgi:DHA2 family methylenomycin A resistance protein-like MFS transporter
VESTSSYIAMLPALLASAINNTSRQAGGAIGIALAGAIAGAPSGSGFLADFHAVAIGSVGLYMVAALFRLAFVPGTLHPGRSVAGAAGG